MICIGDGFCGDSGCAANGCKIDRAWAAGDITPMNDAARAAQAPTGEHPVDAMTRLLKG